MFYFIFFQIFIVTKNCANSVYIINRMFIRIKVNLIGQGGAVELVFLSPSGDFSEESDGESLLYRKELCRWQSCVLKYLTWLGLFFCCCFVLFFCLKTNWFHVISKALSITNKWCFKKLRLCFMMATDSDCPH